MFPLLIKKMLFFVYAIIVGATHCLAETAVDCADPKTFKTPAAYNDSAEACIGDANLVVVNPKIAQKFVDFYCKGSGSSWSSKAPNTNNVDNDKCKTIGATLEFAKKVNQKCIVADDAKDECIEALSTKEKSATVDGVKDAVSEKSKANEGIFAPPTFEGFDCMKATSVKCTAKTGYDGSLNSCIKDVALILTNKAVSLKLRDMFCQKKIRQSEKSAWKTKGEATGLSQVMCDRLGAALDMAKAANSCKSKPDEAKKEECFEKIKLKMPHDATVDEGRVAETILTQLKAGDGFFAAAA